MSNAEQAPASFSRREAAERAGVSVEVVDRHVDLGLLNPAQGDRLSGGDIRRIIVAQTLHAAGVPLEELAALAARGDASFAFLDSPLYERIAYLSTTTFRELAEQKGLPIESVMAIREAMGSAAPQPDDLVREDELLVVPMLEIAAAEGVSLPATERVIRVMGDCLRRLTEAQGRWWQTEVLERFSGDATPLGVLGDATLEFGARMNPAYETAVTAILHAHEHRIWTANILETAERILADAGLYQRVERPPAMCFLDITGFTRLTSERGDAAAAELASTFSRVVQRTSQQYEGRAVKWLGDGVMFYFADPSRGVVAALSMVASAADAGLPPAHVGLHAGPVLVQEGDYYGQTVNIASRIADYARPGEVLVSQAIVDLAGDANLAFSEIGPVELKGISEAIRLHVARRSE